MLAIGLATALLLLFCVLSFLPLLATITTVVIRVAGSGDGGCDALQPWSSTSTIASAILSSH